MSPNETEQSPQAQAQQVMHMNPRIEKDRQLILDAQRKGKGPLLKVYMRLCLLVLRSQWKHLSF